MRVKSKTPAGLRQRGLKFLLTFPLRRNGAQYDYYDDGERRERSQAVLVHCAIHSGL